MQIYDQYAPFYDGSGQIQFAFLFSQYLGEVLERHPVHGRHALDLACGTGTLALNLAESGWQVVGVDQSHTMLALAESKAMQSETSRRTRFIQADVRALPFDGSHPDLQAGLFDLVTCTYDSLNYLLEDTDLANCLHGAATALAPGGLLVVDMNTRHFLEYDWGTCEVIERPGFIQVSQSVFDPQTECSTMRLTGFAGSDHEGYVRFDETHIERAYPPDVVDMLLESAGLRIESAYDCFTFQPHYPKSQRIAWVARKPDKVP